MHTTALIVAGAAFVFVLLFGIDLLAGNRSTVFLKDVVPLNQERLPRVSIVVPARNEEARIEEALQSVLRQDYPDPEFIVINDRSADRTGSILADMSGHYPQLRLIQIVDLPERWLGKNYALYRGAESATGELILFADADVVMDPATLRKAASYMRERQLQHLAVLPEIRMPGVLLGMFTSAFGIFFSLYARPWKAKDPKSRRFIGIGAFNLVSAAAYRAAGTHQAISMRPDDDMKLGKLLKRHGCRQELVFGRGMLHVEWYSSVRELVDGLMKSGFAGVEYSILAGIASGVALLLISVWPFFAVLLTHGSTKLINLGIVVVLLFVTAKSNRLHHIPRWYALGLPLGGILFTYVLWRAMVKTLWEGGIRWRGTYYPLASLKANKI